VQGSIASTGSRVRRQDKPLALSTRSGLVSSFRTGNDVPPPVGARREQRPTKAKPSPIANVGRAAVQWGRRRKQWECLPMAQTGVVKFFNAERGYGFIKPDDGARDVFVHITAVEQAGLKSLNEGQRISFDVEPDKKGKGPKAVNLVVTG
jgi:CspA family cold shock protein